MLLSLSLLYSSLLITTCALPVGAAALELTADTFTKTVEHGLWFIEHYSPYCTHCKHFKPTWEELIKVSEEEFPQLKFSTVDCVVHADLCDKNGVIGYPSLYIYKDGEKVDEFKSNRDLDTLKAFLRKHIPGKPATTEAAPSPAPPKQPKPAVNLDGEVLSLSPNNFYKTLNEGAAFVKFYAPWCGHCKKLAPIWKQLARHMQGKVTIAEVNCDEHQELCKAHNIQGYPSLVWLSKEKNAEGSERHEYNGGRKLEQLRAFVERANAAGVQVLEKDEELHEHIAKDAVVYLLLHRPEDQDIVESVREAAVPLLGTPPLFASSSPALFTQFSIPKSAPWALVAIKDHDVSIPSSTFHGKSSSKSADSYIRTWLLTHRLPTSLELTQDTFQIVMNAPQAPLVVIASVSEGPMKEKVEERLRDVGKKWRVRTEGSGIVNGREVVWALMDKTRWGQWLKSMYGIQKDVVEGGFEDVKVIVADHNKLIYYDKDRTGGPIKIMSSSSLFSAVEDASSGKLRFRNSENFVERLARVLNNKLTVLQDILILHPVKSVFFVLGFIVVFLYLVHRLVEGSNGAEVRRDAKSRNARLD